MHIIQEAAHICNYGQPLDCGLQYDIYESHYHHRSNYADKKKRRKEKKNRLPPKTTAKRKHFPL